MKDWDDIGDAIQAKLETFVGVGQPLVGAYDSHDEKFSGYPCASWEWEDGENEIYTTAENKRTYIATIYVHQEIETRTRSEANRILKQTLSAIQLAFDQDQTLGGACDFTLPGPTKWGIYPGTVGVVRYGGIKLYCVASAIVAS